MIFAMKKKMNKVRKGRGSVGREFRVEKMRNVCQAIKTTRFAKDWMWGMRDRAD